MPVNKRKPAFALLALLAIGAIIYLIFARTAEPEEGERPENIPAVAVAPIELKPMELVRSFSGALEAHSQFVVAPKVSGRIDSIPFDIADTVDRGDVVVLLDDAEFAQDVNQAEADLAVAEANLAEAQSALEIARRQNQRTATLRERGIASESEFDNAQAELLAKEAQVKVAEAQVTRSRSALASARIRLSYTVIAANWNEGDNRRIVADRYVDEGDTVSANDPMLLIVDLDPITAVIFVTERDYGLLKPDMTATFTADSFPGQTFEGFVERISPVFRESSRQARVELRLENPGRPLKPGMFVRANITLAREEKASVVPYAAITRRGDDTGVFLVNEEEDTVSWLPVEVGIRSGESAQLVDGPTEGRVVTLGQHMLDDGSSIIIPDDERGARLEP